MGGMNYEVEYPRKVVTIREALFLLPCLPKLWAGLYGAPRSPPTKAIEFHLARMAKTGKLDPEPSTVSVEVRVSFAAHPAKLGSVH